MSVVVASFSKMSGCWSAHRAIGNCQLCNRVESCKLDEEIKGRKVIAQGKVDQVER